MSITESTEKRERKNAYQRLYREKNPNRVRKWRETYILRCAERLQKQETQKAGEQK